MEIDRSDISDSFIKSNWEPSSMKKLLCDVFVPGSFFPQDIRMVDKLKGESLKTLFYVTAFSAIYGGQNTIDYIKSLI
tara:strand:+ start:64607 stop:64840 length:234 start_codon:yes stop_codon:yes gene_type:complete